MRRVARAVIAIQLDETEFPVSFTNLPRPPAPLEQLRAHEARDRQQLAAAIAVDKSPQWLMFWGHRASPDAPVNSACLSQWWHAPFEADGVNYRTAEHYMMAAGKARLFGDNAAELRILHAEHPAQAKALGRSVRGFSEEVWSAHRVELVIAGNLAKFNQHPHLREYLLSTGASVLVEASPYDRVWGIGVRGSDPRAVDPAKWPGLNLLGFALMRVRAKLVI
jgi:ribA/ribD-fused uncharacterized protein